MPEVVDFANAGFGDPDDVLRSLRRYVAQTLGSPPWTVRLQRTQVADDERPVAILEPGVLTTPFARRAIDQGDVQKMQPFTVVCYPVAGATAAESAEIARDVASLLDAGISRGLVSDAVPPQLIGGPFRIPVYFFGGTPIRGETRAGPADAYMHASVDETFSVRPIQDALDELRYTVVASLRVSWWQGGRVPPAAPKAASLTGGWRAGVRGG